LEKKTGALRGRCGLVSDMETPKNDSLPRHCQFLSMLK